LNVICPNRIDPATKAYAGIMYPAINVPGAGNVVNSKPDSLNQYQINTRADYKFTDKLTFFARYSHATVDDLAPQPLPAVFTSTLETFNNAVASWTYVPSPTMVADFKLGVNRDYILQTATNPAPGATAYLAANPLQGVAIKNAKFPLYPAMGISGFNSPFQSGVPAPTTDLEGVLNMSKIKGRNTFKVGFSIDNVRGLQDNLNQTSFSFTPDPTVNPANPNPGSTGSGLASFLLGLPNSGQRSLGDTAVHMRWGQYQFYGQDDLKLTKRLTFNLGLRYEWDQVPRDPLGHLSQFDRLSNTFIWASKNPVTGQRQIPGSRSLTRISITSPRGLGSLTRRPPRPRCVAATRFFTLRTTFGRFRDPGDNGLMPSERIQTV
jgi:outer membrane receptor protein involved in Fe transport